MNARSRERHRPRPTHEVDALLEARLGGSDSAAPVGSAISWIADPDLALLVRLLGEEQRLALTLRFRLDLTMEQVAEVMGKRPDATKKLIQRALAVLEQRLTVSRDSDLKRRRNTMLTRIKPLPVLGARRFALW